MTADSVFSKAAGPPSEFSWKKIMIPISFPRGISSILEKLQFVIPANN